ncbi:hypothetical protein VI817_008003 [Penicillium citrinum]|nr:hypothetical protein VI817_008003 [Penicillium citrinum]
MFTATGGYVSILRIVLSMIPIYADYQMPLILAADHGRYQFSQILINLGANINAAGLTGTTPLLYAVRVRNASIIQLMLNHGAHVNVKDAKGLTPLLLAVNSKFPRNHQGLRSRES